MGLVTRKEQWKRKMERNFIDSNYNNWKYRICIILEEKKLLEYVQQTHTKRKKMQSNVGETHR